MVSSVFVGRNSPRNTWVQIFAFHSCFSCLFELANVIASQAESVDDKTYGTPPDNTYRILQIWTMNVNRFTSTHLVISHPPNHNCINHSLFFIIVLTTLLPILESTHADASIWWLCIIVNSCWCWFVFLVVGYVFFVHNASPSTNQVNMGLSRLDKQITIQECEKYVYI